MESMSFMKTAIQITDLQFNYKDQPTILAIPSWQVMCGEHLFLHGVSGSGKSTLLNILSGILPVSYGQITIFDTVLNSLSNQQRDRFRAMNIGNVFQRFNLVPYLTAMDNVRLAYILANKRETHQVMDEKIKTYLTSLGIKPTHWHLPSDQLSIGQQQRVAIARAMIYDPKMLIVDEPTSSLDHHSRDAFLQLLLKQTEQNNVTLIFVSHDQTLAHYFSRTEAIEDINHA
jgi:putative ABC transport system ATP-binding protein